MTTRQGHPPGDLASEHRRRPATARASAHRRRPLFVAAVAAALLAALLAGAPPAQAAHTLATPTNLVATAADGAVVLSWGAVANADGYRIEHGVQLSGTTTTATTTATSHTVSGLTNGQFYVFRVQATDSGGTHTTSAYSGWVTAMPLAQTATRLVSNLAQSSLDPNDPTRSYEFETDDGVQSGSQEFTTGASPITLESIELYVFSLHRSGYNAAQSANVRVELWSSNSNGTPNARLAELEVPTTLPVGTHAFKAPAGTELAANTTYHVVIYSLNSQNFVVSETVVDDEDPGAAAGWSIANGRNYLGTGDPNNRGSTNWGTTRSSKSVKMAVRGYPPLVSNLSQSAGAASVSVSTGSVSQRFITGANSAGYVLSSVEVDVGTALNATAAAKVRAELWSADDNGFPAALLEALEVPSTLSAGVNTLKAPPGTVLAPETRYNVVFYTTTTTQALVIAGDSSDDEDPGAAEGWTLGNRRLVTAAASPHSLGANTWGLDGAESLKIAVKGAARSVGSGKPIWSATLNPAEVDTGKFGCELGVTDCSGATVLSSDDFVYEGSSFGVNILAHSNSATDSSRRLSLQVRPDMDHAAYEDLTLHVGHRTFAVADAAVSHETTSQTASEHFSGASWSSTGMTWAASDQIRVTLTIPETSSNNDLSALSASTHTGEAGTFSAQTLTRTGTQTQGFDKTATSYSVTVGSDVAYAKLTATVDDTGKARMVAGKTGSLSTLDDRATSGPIALAVGDNELVVRVTAENGDTQDYTVNIRRQSADVELSALSATKATASGSFSGLTLSPGLAAGVTQYSVLVTDPLVTRAKVRANARHADATVQVAKAGAAFATLSPNTDSGVIALGVGANEIVVRVTAEDTSVSRDYTLTITVDGTPSAPADLAVTSEARSVSVSWTPPAVSVDGYDVHYTTNSGVADDAAVGFYEHPRQGRVVNRNPGRGWVSLSHGPLGKPEYGLGGLNPGTTYRMRVRAYNRHGIGPWAVGSATPGDAARTVSLSASAVRVREGDAVTVTATVMHDGRATPVQEDMDVMLSVHLGTAEEGDVGEAERISIAKYTARGSVTVPTHRDADGDDETFAVLIRWIPKQSLARVGDPRIVWVTITESGAAPPEPVVVVPGLRVSGGDGVLYLSWDRTAATQIAGYDVEYKKSSAPDRPAVAGDAATGWVDAGHTGTDRSVTVSGLDNWVDYDTRVRLVFGDGTGPWSDVVSAHPAARVELGEPTAVSVAVSDATPEEGETVTVTATLDDPAPREGATVQFFAYGDTIGGTVATALAGSDYRLDPPEQTATSPPPRSASRRARLPPPPASRWSSTSGPAAATGTTARGSTRPWRSQRRASGCTPPPRCPTPATNTAGGR